MASKRVSGYDLHWVEDPPDDLKCLICLCVARDPRQHPGDDTNDCGKVFCSECITEYQRSKTTCPNCQQNLTLFKDTRSTRAIKAMKVKCNGLTNGCDWTGELGSLETHLQSCDYALLPCTKKCKTDCEVFAKFPRKDLNNHLANDCPRRQYKCPHCKQTGEHQERTTTHLETCPKVRVSCTNSDCENIIFRCDIPTHQTTCEYEPVTCKYAAIGCNEIPSRKELKKHEEDALLHLEVTTQKNLELTQRVTVLETSMLASNVLKEERKSTNLACTIKLINYQEHKNDSKQFYIPPFYTSYSGYKMCLLVDANGNGFAADTHVSVGVNLMKGDHDGTLTWPFTGSITIELLNQLEDKNHLKETLTFPADNAVSKRVVDGERGLGFGILKFISHAALNYNARANRQYLKNDTLVFKVSVEIPDHKPWLECTM